MMVVPRLLLAPLVAAVCTSGGVNPPGQHDSLKPTDDTAGPVAAPGECVDRHTRRTAGGAPQDCYPYVCRAGACLTRCDDRRDCAGAQDPSELATQGWPLECMPGGACTPMHPDKVD